MNFSIVNFCILMLSRHLRYTGDTVRTINDVGFATFTGIESSADWFLTCFKDHTMTAGI